MRGNRWIRWIVEDELKKIFFYIFALSYFVKDSRHAEVFLELISAKTTKAAMSF